MSNPNTALLTGASAGIGTVYTDPLARTLAGIDSVDAPQDVRIEAWSRLARDLDLKKLARTTQVVGLSRIPEVVARMFEGKVQGRTVVDVNA